MTQIFQIGKEESPLPNYLCYLRNLRFQPGTTYRNAQGLYSVDGRQYIAVISPGGTLGSSSHVGQLRARVPIGQRNVGHTLFVFALPE